MKKIARRIILSSPLLRHLLETIADDFPRIFVYHRFSAPGVDIPHRVRQDLFAWQLDQLQTRYQVITLADCVSCLAREGRWPDKAVVLTVDDGYADFYQYAYPELKKRGIGATFFVTVGFVNRDLWLWPDRIECAINRSRRDHLTYQLGNDITAFPLEAEEQRALAVSRLTEYGKTLSDKDRLAFLEDCEKKLEAQLPDNPPPEFEAVTWDQLMEMHANGIEIGSHTMTHPILSRVDDEKLSKEINDSKKVLEGRIDAPVQSFCYPNSAEGDIDDRALSLMKASDYSSAVFGINLNRWDIYRLPRMGIGNDKNDFLWKVSGLENFRIKRDSLPPQVRS